tara:strand:+ start:1118 stop:1894 length:777 start_codon:yes stop_codon:yes gene_type:complete
MATKKQDNMLSLFEDNAGAGIGEISADDLATPRISIVQAMSPQIKKSSPKYSPDAKVGDMMFTATNTFVDGDEGIRFLPVFYDRNYVEWKMGREGFVGVHPLNTPLMAQTTRDASYNDVLTKPDGSTTILQNTANHYGFAEINGELQRCVINMSRSQLKVSRAWIGLINGTRMNGAKGDFTPPSYSHWYVVRSVEIEGAKGSYYNFAVTQERPLNNKEAELFEEAQEFSSFCEKGGMQPVLPRAEQNAQAIEDQSTDW